jgi:hypothetical protein
MKIHAIQGIAPNGEDWLVTNRICPARPWPCFKDIEPCPMLLKMSERLFNLCQSQEIIISAPLLPYFAEIAKRVKRVKFESVHLVGSQAGECHFDTCRDYDPGRDSYYTGFSLFLIVDRLTWQPHSWLMRGDVLIEYTPSIWHAYWGVALDPEEVAAHCKYLTNGEIIP